MNGDTQVDSRPKDAEATAPIHRRLVHWAVAPLSKSTRSLLLLGGVVLPLGLHLLSPVSSPRWQSGQLRDQLAFILTADAGFVLYPLELYAVISLALYLYDEAKHSLHFLIRVGIFGGMLIATWYCFIFALSIAETDPTDIGSIARTILAFLVQFVILLVLWMVTALVRWFSRKIDKPAIVVGLFCFALYVVVVVAVSQFALELEIGEALYVPLVLPFVVSLVCGPAWAFLSYAAVSARLIFVSNEARRFSLLQLMGITTYLAAFCAACRASVMLSLESYSKLPLDPPNNCYVATAAARGHRWFVGSSPVSDSHEGTLVNRQLNTLKAFEVAWQMSFPASHRWTRKLYDRVGPPMARKICSPWVADIAFLTLKPVEWVALLVLSALLGNERHLIDQVYSGERKSRHETFDDVRRFCNSSRSMHGSMQATSRRTPSVETSKVTCARLPRRG